MGWMIGLAVVVAITLILYILGIWKFDYFKKRQIPFVRSNIPFIGSGWSLALQRKSFPDFIKDIYSEFEDFKYVGFFDFSYPAVMIRDPEMIKMVTVKDFDCFTDRVNPIKDEIDPIFAKNLMSLDGQKWKDMRAMLSPVFTSSKMKAMYGLICESGDQLVKYLEKTIKGEEGGVLELDIRDLFTKFTHDVIASAAFGVTCDSLENPDNEFYAMGKAATDFSGILRGLTFVGFRIAPKLMKFLGITIFSRKVTNFFNDVVSNNIAQREREGIVRPDMIHLMMEARKDQSAQGHSAEGGDSKHRKKMDLTDEDITAQAFLFLGGFDNSSNHLSFIIQLLAIHPEVQELLQKEIDAVLDAEDGKLTYETIHSMKYLDMCISEVLRLWPPVPFSNRTCNKPYVLPATENTPSFCLEKGVEVWIPIYGIHRDRISAFPVFPRP